MLAKEAGVARLRVGNVEVTFDHAAPEQPREIVPLADRGVKAPDAPATPYHKLFPHGVPSFRNPE